MTDREKVIKGLECCKPIMTQYGLGACDACPYDRASIPEYGICDCLFSLLTDALDLLKAQEPRVMTLEEIQQSLRGGDTAFLLDVEDRLLIWTLYMAYNARTNCIVLRDDTDDVHVLRMEDYGVTWRCWTARPTDEQREAEAW